MSVHPIRQPDPERVKPERAPAVEIARQPERYGDYRDRLYRSALYSPWTVEHTAKRAGDLVVTSTGVERHG